MKCNIMYESADARHNLKCLGSTNGNIWIPHQSGSSVFFLKIAIRQNSHLPQELNTIKYAQFHNIGLYKIVSGFTLLFLIYGL